MESKARNEQQAGIVLLTGLPGGQQALLEKGEDMVKMRGQGGEEDRQSLRNPPPRPTPGRHPSYTRHTGLTPGRQA